MYISHIRGQENKKRKPPAANSLIGPEGSFICFQIILFLYRSQRNPRHKIFLHKRINN